MADKQDLKISERLLQLREAINKLNSQDDELTEKQQETLMKQEATLAKILKYQQKRVKDAVGTHQAELDLKKSYSEQLSSISSISSIYDGLKSAQSQSLTTIEQTLSAVQQSLLVDESKREVLTSTLDGINTLQELQQKLAETGPDQLEVQKSIRDAYNSQQNSLIEQVKSSRAFGIIAEDQETALLAALETQKDSLKQAEQYGTISADNKETLQAQIDVYKGIDKSIRGVINTAKLLTSNLKAGIGIATAALGGFANKFGDVNKELGQSFLQGMNASTVSATALGFVFEDTAGTVKSLASEFGGVEAATLSAQANVGLIAANMGISNTEAVGLMGSFARLNGGSADMAADMIKTTQEFANQNGIIPADLMADLAGSAEEFALFGKDGGKNILEAAGYAKKLGVNMGTISGMADNLLDFESSITKELELGAMLGKDINLDRARALAYSGELEEATKETLNALGGQAAFAEMDYFQRKASADLLGVSVAELEKMVANEGKAATMGDAVNKQFSAMGETLNMGLNNYLGTSLQGIGGMLVSAGQMSPVLKDMGINMGGMVKNTAQVLKNLLGMVAGPVINGIKAIGGGLMDSFGGSKLGESIGGIKDKLVEKGSALKDKLMAGVGDKAKDKLMTGPVDTAKDIKTPEMSGGDKAAGSADKLGKINGAALIQAAAAMLIMAAALYVMAKGLQEFNTVDPTSLLKAAGALLILGGALYGLSVLLAPLAASGILYMVAAGMLAMGAAVFLVGAGIKLFGEGVAILGSALPSMVQPLMELSQINFLPILGLAATLGVLAFALMGFGLAGLAAAPALLIVGASIMMLGTGLTLISTALTTLSGGLGSVLGILPQIGSVLSGMFEYVGPIAMLSLSLGTLSLALMGFGLAGLVAAPGLLLVGGGIMMIGTGLNLITTSLATLGGGLTSVITAMSTVGSVIGELFQYIAPIAALSLALVGLAGALTLVSVAGVAALPGLMAVAAVGAIAVGVGSMLGMGGEGEGKKDDSTQLLIDEMKGLRADLNAGKISVNMDGTKVTSAVSRVVSKVGSNSYAI